MTANVRYIEQTPVARFWTRSEHDHLQEPHMEKTREAFHTSPPTTRSFTFISFYCDIHRG